MAKNKKQKYYTVWSGVNPGVYDNWLDCRLQIQGFTGAVFKSFDTKSEAEAALNDFPSEYIGKKQQNIKSADNPNNNLSFNIIREDELSRDASENLGREVKFEFDVLSIAVDAACSGNPGDMEYRGVYVETGQEIFHVGPMKRGTNNIGEFLALVHGLALLKKTDCTMPVYSDSKIAIGWIKQKQCRTKLERTAVNEPIFNLIKRAEKWLCDNSYPNKVLKWETAEWGEIPADFGRK